MRKGLRRNLRHDQTFVQVLLRRDTSLHVRLMREMRDFVSKFGARAGDGTARQETAALEDQQEEEIERLVMGLPLEGVPLG